MGIIKAWELQKEDGVPIRWRAIQKDEFNYHRTRINEVVYGNGQLWTGVRLFSYVCNSLISTSFCR
jgi:hypothetical protein